MTTREKIEFASPAWLAELQRLIRTCSAQAGNDLELILCEVFTGVPRHLDKHGNGKLSWYCRIANGEVEFREGEIDDADVKTVADYTFILALARMKIEPATTEAYQTKL